MKKIPNLINALGAFKSVKNLVSHSGTIVPNQFIIKFEHGTVFQSYNVVVGVRFQSSVKKATSLRNKIILTSYWDYSSTTLRYLKRGFFYNNLLTKSDIAKMIKSKEVILIDSIEFE